MKITRWGSVILLGSLLFLTGCHEMGRDRDYDRSWGRESYGRMERFEGTVTIVDRGHRTFEMGLRNSNKVVFFVGDNTSPAARDRFGSLRVGDYVRAEGRHRDANNFDLEMLR